MSHASRKPEAQWVGSKATTYLERPLAAQRIFKVAPRSKIIVLLRDPIARAISNYHYTRAHGLEQLPIDEALRPQSQSRPWNRASISTNPFAYLDRGRYPELLTPWLASFGSVSIFILEELLSGEDSLERLGQDMSITVDDFSLAYTHENRSDSQGEQPSGDTLELMSRFFQGPQLQLEALLGREVKAWKHPAPNVLR
jgi:hypothetical protein